MLWKMKVSIVPVIIRALETVPKSQKEEEEKKLKELKTINSRDHLDDSIME